MRKLDLSRWAAISEIIATAAVVASLLLVAYNIKQNTDEIETANSNLLYQLDEQVTSDLSRDERLASIFDKVEQEEALSDTEKFQYVYLWHRYLSVWEIAWTQFRSGSLSSIDWCDWDRYLSESFTDAMPEERWIEIRSDYKPEFAEHVDAKYADN
jgi:hypothetical protein